MQKYQNQTPDNNIHDYDSVFRLYIQDYFQTIVQKTIQIQNYGQFLPQHLQKKNNIYYLDLFHNYNQQYLYQNQHQDKV